MSINWLSHLNCAPLKRKQFRDRMLFIAANFDKLMENQGDQAPALDRTSLYMAMDSDLAALFKQVKDAEANFARLKQIFAKGDPMLDMAIWQLESCQSGFDTRLLELEADKKVSRRVDDILAGEDELDYRPLNEVQLEAIQSQPRRKSIGTGALLFWAFMTMFNPNHFMRTLRPAYVPG